MPRYGGAAGPGGGRHGSARAGRGQGVVTVRSGCPELCPRARGSARAGEGGSCGARGSTRRGSKGKASRRPGRVRGSRGSLPGGRGTADKGIWSPPPTGTVFAARFGTQVAAIASSRLWGEPAGLGGGEPGICGFGSPKDPVSGARGPARRPLPLRQVFVQRPLCVCGRGWGLGSWPGDSPAS